jgi:TetR/AcrR family transcriptional regulator, mexCD-oprJ operon repressor
MSANPAADPRQATAERNVEAILDAAERLLRRGERATISAVAGEAGVSRVTVYSHFRDRERLLEALTERQVKHVMAAIDSADPNSGSAMDALQRIVAAAWEQIARNEEIGRAASAELSADALRRAHEAAHGGLRRLVDRGRREGTFRTDLEPGWMVTSCLALIHAAAEEVRAGALGADAALEAVSATVADLVAARA